MSTEAFERLIGGPRDGSLLRYSPGLVLLKQRSVGTAQRLREAVNFDPDYTAAGSCSVARWAIVATSAKH